MVLFTNYDLFTMNFIWWEWEKTPEMRWNEKCRNQGKIPRWLPSYPHVYEMEAGCFPVSEDTENKPGLP